jgi:hypothetical protein
MPKLTKVSRRGGSVARSNSVLRTDRNNLDLQHAAPCLSYSSSIKEPLVIWLPHPSIQYWITPVRARNFIA